MSFFKSIFNIFSESYDIDDKKANLKVVSADENNKKLYHNILQNSNTIIGAISGDIIGSVYEFQNTKRTDFQLFSNDTDYTDDSVLTIAIADCILNKKDYAHTLKDYGIKYQGRGYGTSFKSWLYSNDFKPYNSWGNGSAMRVSPVGFACNSISEVLRIAKETADVTHNHPDGVRGAQATASAIFLARTGNSKEQIKKYIVDNFGYNLNKNIDSIRPSYSFDVSCSGSVPPAITAFLESSDYESAIRLAISIGGDSDTIACITGGIASAYYKTIPSEILKKVIELLPVEFLKIISDFDKQYK
jgi:ADP-ribosyl-[dinitrogen reductase] hydrolase